MVSDDYHDYVIKDGKLIGDFDGMYTNSKYIPWHQDELIRYTSDKQLVSLVRSYGCSERIVEVGCGLGYFANQFHTTGGVVTGFDVSPVAIEKARGLFPDITFEVLDITKEIPDKHIGAFDVVIVKDILWYVFPHLDAVFKNIRDLSSKHGMIFISQSFPKASNYVGWETIRNPIHLVHLFQCNGFDVDFYSENHNKVQNWDTIIHVACKKR